uniref:Dynamin-type G domain-containing protein n=1 Tax=Denticeps clupeoides TaxID=299321 RepID=A0A8C4B1F1_9TELE
MDPEDASPLKHFVVAKRTISCVFEQLLEYVRDASDFVKETCQNDDLDGVAEEDQCAQLQACFQKLLVIREVLARRHMKVAFFGRTSNGKSTVINAMLRERVLPTGIGHTTNCFLSVEGSDEDMAYLTAEGSDARRSIETVNHLAHALHMDPNLDSGSLVCVYWPKAKCALLRDDLVLMDSPGIDVTSELDSWIDKFCLDADVFVLVANSESTLMNTEKHFFHQVSERISKPNIFILNNRWDASVAESEYLEEVRQQHLQRCMAFLVEELKVVDAEQAPRHIFFVSAKEVLSSRMHRAQGMPETGGALAEGFQERLKEFQSFERAFEEFISQSAVKTKFEQHTLRASQITESVKSVMDAINISSAEKKVLSLEEREALTDRLEFVRNQINFLSENVKEKIKALSDEVASQVSVAMADEIRGLTPLVSNFSSDFSTTPLIITQYKSRLVEFLEDRIRRNLISRCSELCACVCFSTDSILPLLPPAARSHLHLYLPSRRFDLTYDLNLATLCADFQEDIEFRFSLGWTMLVNRFLGPLNAKRALTTYIYSIYQTPLSRAPIGQPDSLTHEELAVSMAARLVSLTSRASMGVVIIGGVWRCVGWRLLALSLTAYALLYLYEKVTWTNSSRERALKQQFVEFAMERLQALMPICSAHCGQQVQQEMSTTLARLCQQVDKSEMDLETDIRQISTRIHRLEAVQRHSKTLRSVSRMSCLVSRMSCLVSRMLRSVSRMSCLVSRMSCLVSRMLRSVSRMSCLVSRMLRLVSRMSCLVSRMLRSVSRMSCLVSRMLSLVSRMSCLVSRMSCLVSRMLRSVSRMPCLVSRMLRSVSRMSCLVSRKLRSVSSMSCMVSRKLRPGMTYWILT